MLKKSVSCLIFFCIFIMQNIFILAKGEPTKKVIMIDLDGVLYNYTRYTDEIPSIRNGAKKFIKELSNNYELVLFTTRSPKQAVNWLQENKIDKYFKDVTNVKFSAYIYIDDRAIKFEGNYDKTIKEIESFRVHWKT